MIPIEEAIAYFHSDGSIFWNWVEDGQVIEWKNGDTICYQKDLIELLKGIQSVGLPPLDALLLAISACHYGQVKDEHKEIFRRYRCKAEIRFRAFDNLYAISLLPLQLRSGAFRIHLFREIFNASPHQTDPYKAKQLIRLLESGDLKNHLVQKKAQSSPQNRMEIAFESFANTYNGNELELILRTGLEQVPEPAPLPQPDPRTSQDDLLTQLSQDQQTAGLSRLTKRLIAALNIPPHTQGASDQPLGGVSDISNRGDFDRLLLSELANDDDTLSARLVNNEALYLRRETPPDPQVQERVILVDTSLRLWGIPRVFAVSAALGCALNNHQKAGISAFALGKELIGPNALATREEVIHFLAQQSPVLHSGEALRAFFRQQPRSAQRAVFFITSEEVMADKNFSLIFAEQQQHLDYLLVLSRTGTLLFYKLVNGQRSLMSTSVFDLEELLFKQPRGIQSQSTINKDNWPHALKLDQFPLFIPMMSSQVLFSYPISETSALAVTINFELHFWHSKDKGSILIAKDIPAQSCWFGQQNPNQVTLLGKLYLPGFGIRNRVYVFNIEERTHLEINLDEHPISSSMSFVGHRDSGQKGVIGNIIDAYFENENWFINTINGPEGILNYYIVNIQHNYVFHSHVPEPRRQTETKLVSKYIDFNKIINNGYSIHHKINTIRISRSNWIKLNDWEIQLSNNSLAFRKDIHNIRHSEHEHLFVEFKPVDSTKYGLILKNGQLNNNVEAFIDNRGFLYLRTTDQSLPEVCITLVSNREMAAYASDHTYTGNRYFIPEENEQFVHPAAFYQTYIQPYIKLILQL